MDTDLICGTDDRPSLRETLFVAIQYLLAIFVAIITPLLIIVGALKPDLKATGLLVSMALFVSGVSTFVQCRKLGPVGVGLLCVQGTSFLFTGSIITVGLAGRPPLIFGVCVAASPVEIIVSRTFKYLRSVITPLVSGIMVLLIDLGLTKVGVIAYGGGYMVMDSGAPGSLRNVGVAVCVLLSVLLFNRCENKYLRVSSIVLGLCIGYTVAFAMGVVDTEVISSRNLRGFNTPVPSKYGLDFNTFSLVAIALIYLITAVEATGDVTINSMISGKSIEGKGYLRRAPGGVLVDGVDSFISGIFNSSPNFIFARNNGVIQLTRVASRYVGYYIADVPILLGLFPVVGVIFSSMPDPVLGRIILPMFGMVAAAGIHIIAIQDINREAMLVLMVSLSLGLGVELMPNTLRAVPQVIRGIFSSGIMMGGLTATLTNLFICIKEDQTE